MHTQSLLVLVTGAHLLVNTALRVQNALRRIQNWPGYRVLFTTRYIFGTLLPFESIGYLYREAFKVWKDKHSEFAEHGVDVISGLVVFPYPNVVMMVADASAVKEITAHRSRFPKPLQPYKTIDVFGANIVGSEGEQWKRHKKISAPAFSEPNNKMVWDETARVMSELVNDVWGTSQEVTVDHATTLTLPIALFIIGSAGFGQRISWEEEQGIPPGHQMSFKEALHILYTDTILKAITPDWLLKYGPTRLRRVGKAFKEMKTYMTEMVQHRKLWHAEERHHDLFSNLLKANDEDADITLSDSELLGNIFVFLLAGHETTAHTLCFSLALLALYQDEQTKMYQNIQKVMAHKQVPTYEDAPSLAYCQAVFYETLRLFPPLPVIQKLAAEDTVLSTVNAAGETVTVPIPAGAGIGIHTPGLHYNPRYWDDPYTFKPSRFLGEWPRDAFVPFSEGARSCLGRRFSETEATVILAMLVSRYKIEVKEEAQFSGETFEQRKERILKARPGPTLTPVKVPLVFKRR